MARPSHGRARSASNRFRGPGSGIATSLVLALWSCASPGVGSGGAATDAEWLDLATPRPVPLPGAPRVALGSIEAAGPLPWELATPVPLDLGLSELVVAGLLRRRDVEFVERRRFAAAAEAERSGRPRGPRAPPVGVSRGAELTAAVVWLPLGTGQAAAELRLASSATGAVVGSGRTTLPADSDIVGAARTIVAALLATLEETGRLPAWEDPIPQAAPGTFLATGIPDSAVESFLRGLAAEEQWNWEAARRSYGAASASPGFLEAEAALARAARLRNGGTLGES
jgi:hypothetical protein